MPKRLPLLLCLFALAGCAPPRRQAEGVLKRIGADNLREGAARLYKDFFASSAPDYTSVKSSEWPSVFSAFAPKQVGAYRDGFALALTLDGNTESGLYVIPAHMDVQPHANPRARFERIADGIYWYSFTR